MIIALDGPAASGQKPGSVVSTTPPLPERTEASTRLSATPSTGAPATLCATTPPPK